MINISQLTVQNPDLVYFEDDIAYIFFGLDPIATGQFKIFPKEPYQKFEDIPGKISAHLFTLTNTCSTILFELLKSHGTNILVRDGVDSQNPYDRVCIETIARFENDNLDMLWQPKQGNMSELTQVAKSITDAFILDLNGKPITTMHSSPQNTQTQQATAKSEQSKLQQTSTISHDKIQKPRKNYWDEQLLRIP
jgi:diadenosine tetraphosphate (Ap4A) HIT family hydrolase